MKLTAAWGAMLALPAIGHQLFLMPSSFHVSPGERIIVGLHNGDSFPDSEGPPSIERLRDVTLHAGKLQYNVTNLRADGLRLIGDAHIAARGTLVFSAHTVPNFIELQADAFEKYLKEEGMGQVIEWRKQHGESARPGREMYSKYVKSLVRSGSSGGGGDTFSRAVGFPVELLPEKDPYSLKSGARMPVRLLWRGKPATNIMVEAAIATTDGPAESLQVGRTDAQGRVQVYLSKPGKWRLHAIAIERCSEAVKADWESFWASLTFDLAK